ncbi:MAG: transcriptional repressor LexA [Azospirillaceae bacterium]|nr:transcriptional repressor LexA [Azospirillaceae bacterium]
MLTRKQQELLQFIHRRLAEGGVSPSFDEMKEALGLRSKSGIHRLITGLEERGFIRRLAHRARALEVLRVPDGLCGGEGPVALPPVALPPVVLPPVRAKFQPNVIKADFPPAALTRETAPRSELVQLPLYGRIAAGTPIEALRDNSAFVDVAASLLDAGDHYALQVAGDSMIEAGILDGDTAIIRRCDTAENGAIVVALIDGAEVTLKRLRRKGDSIALHPANPAYETRLFPADRVQVQGRLVALLRRY